MTPKLFVYREFGFVFLFFNATFNVDVIKCGARVRWVAPELSHESPCNSTEDEPSRPKQCIFHRSPSVDFVVVEGAEQA